MLSSDLTWSQHTDCQLAKCNKLLGSLQRFKYRWSRKALETCYLSFIRPIIEYGNILYDNCSMEVSKKIDSMQATAARLVLGVKRGTSLTAMYHELGWEKLSDRRKVYKLTKLYCVVNNMAPHYLTELFNDYKLKGTIITRAQQHHCFQIPLCQTSFYKNSFVISSITAWNQLDPMYKNLPSKATFKKHMKKLYTVEKWLLFILFCVSLK